MDQARGGGLLFSEVLNIPALEFFLNWLSNSFAIYGLLLIHQGGRLISRKKFAAMHESGFKMILQLKIVVS